MYTRFLAGVVCVILFAHVGGACAVDTLNSPENELALTGSATEAWLERRGGRWGKSSEASRILYLRRRDQADKWSRPEEFPPVMVGGDGGEPFYHSASDSLYFTSTRPHPDLTDSAANIWRVRRRAGHWGEPEPLPAPVNGPAVEYSPVTFTLPCGMMRGSGLRRYHWSQ